MAGTGRLFTRKSPSPDLQPLAWDDGDPWKLWLDVRQDDRDQWKITGSLRRGEERMELTEPSLHRGGRLSGGARHKIARLDDGGAFPWITRLLTLKQIPFPDRERDNVMSKLLDLNVVPPLDVDEALKFEERRVQPQPRAARHAARKSAGARSISRRSSCWITDAAGPKPAPPAADSGSPKSASTWSATPNPRTPRARSSRNSACVRTANRPRPGAWVCKSMPKVVARIDPRRLARGGGRQSLPAAGDHAGRRAHRHRLVRTARRGGLRRADREPARSCWPPCGAATPWSAWATAPTACLPEEWLERFAPLAGLGTKEEDHLRFRRNQAGLLDALLAAQPEVRVDELFERVRERMRDLQRREVARRSPPGFVGQLRDYQCEGLGWMEFLREFGFGGCLADDMGVGKTAQVLAVLEARRTEGHRPVAGGGAEIADVQLARRGAALHAATARAGAHRPGARRRADRRSTIWC